ncbi:MAG: oligosaccharide flippase family protein [Eubacteriales bacterium]|nr:oligosaccharide flippase family protein [Eubacteriales bacterium]
MMDNRYQKLVKNTAIFAVGNFGSKILVFLIVPLYTYMLSKAEYGLVDLITSTMQLMIPFTSLLIQEALIRFVLSKEVDNRVGASNCLTVFAFGTVLTILFIPLYLLLFEQWLYAISFVVLQILNTYTTIFSQYLRADNKSIAFSVNGVISTLSLILLNVFFLVGLKLGVKGYILALILSQVISACFIAWQMHFFKTVSIKLVNTEILKQMLKYSIPLIPNSLMWWIMNAGDKYIINYFLGYEANGLYALAVKIPTILTTVYTIFMQAFQMSAIEEMNEETSGDFYSRTFKVTAFFTFFIAQTTILFAKPLYTAVMAKDFVESWTLVPMLCVANIFSCFASFAATAYIINKKSQRAFFTTAIGALINVVLNVALIRQWGLLSVAFATCVGYFIVMFIRFIDAQKAMHVNFGKVSVSIISVLVIIEALVLMHLNGVLYYSCCVGVLIAIMIIYRKELFKCKAIFGKIIVRIFKKSK